MSLFDTIFEKTQTRKAPKRQNKIDNATMSGKTDDQRTQDAPSSFRQAGAIRAFSHRCASRKVKSITLRRLYVQCTACFRTDLSTCARSQVGQPDILEPTAMCGGVRLWLLEAPCKVV